MTRRRQVRTTKTGYGSAWLWFFCGLVSGLLLATIALQSGWIRTPESLQIPEQPIDDDDPAGIAGGQGELPERQYDFFRVLPEQDHIVPPEQIEQDSRNNNDGLADTASSYQLQVGSFRSETDADALKANLLLLGVDVRVIPVNVDGVTWHRVRVGPLNSAREANAIRQRLENNGYQTLVLREQ